MAQYNQYATNSNPQPSDLVLTFSSNNSDTRKLSLSALAAYIQTYLSAPGQYIKQYFAPNATGFSVTISPVSQGASVWLLMTPLAGYAAGTVTLPLNTTLQDGQTFRVTSTQAVTTLTVAGNGATVNGAPTTLAANAFFELSYDKVNNSYYRVG